MWLRRSTRVYTITAVIERLLALSETLDDMSGESSAPLRAAEAWR